MGIKGVCKFFTQTLFLFSVLALVILLVPNLPPDAPIQESYKLAPNRPLEGKLALNERLNKAELWHKGDLIGAESFADFNGELYTGLYTGEIVKLTGQHITKIVKTGQPCRGAFEERICGRPLGMEFDKNGALYVADAYYGILKVDVKTGRKEVVVSPNQKIAGKQPKLFNSLALAKNGDIFWTDSSTNFYLDDIIFDSLADPSGRLIHYDAKTKKNTVLMNNIFFANGILLTPDESAVFVAETFKNRIVRYHLKGPKKGTHDVLIDGLPGMPDNLRHDGTGNGFLVPFVMSTDDEQPGFNQMLSQFPKIRKFLARIMGLNKMLFEMIDRFYPNDFSLRAIHFIGHFTSVGLLLPPANRSTVAHISNNGEILDSVHALKHIHSSSEAYIFKDTLYIGSPFQEYIGRVKLSDIGWQHLIQKVPSGGTPRQETAAPKPTTTPRPATTTTKAAPTQNPTTVPPTQPPKQKPVTTAPPPVKEQAPTPAQRQTPPPAQQKTAPPPAQKQPPPPVQKQAPPPVQKQSPPPAAQKQTPPPAQKQTQPPPAPKQTPPPQQQQQTQTPPPQQQKQTPPSQQQKQTSPQQQKQTPPPAQKQAPPPPAQKQAPPPPAQKQNAPQAQKQAPPTPAQKQSPPPAQKQTPPPPSVQKETPPPTKQMPTKQQSTNEPAAAKPVPVKEAVKTK